MSSHEIMAKAGLGDWQRAMHEAGQHRVAYTLEQLDPGNAADGRNAHTVIAQRLGELGLPVQSYTTATVSDFLAHPQDHLDRIRTGEYYFASIIPGTHLAHGGSPEEVIAFTRTYAESATEADLAQEMYISHNGEPIMSGHIIVKDDGTPNTILAEFTIGNFNAFHRGSHTPEISTQRHEHRFLWQYRGALDDTSQHEEQEFLCQRDIKLTRTEMARRALYAMSRIPHDEDYYLPGYYEVLFEHTQGKQTKPVFIEANFSGLW